MIKRLLGIKDLERNLKQLKLFMRNYSAHTKNLYKSVYFHHHKLNNLEQNYVKIEQLDKKMNSILSFIEKIVERLEVLEEANYAVEMPAGQEETKQEEVLLEEKQGIIEKPDIFVGDREKIILQILHQNAAINRENAISTTKIYENLPFNITQRGLRKKLDSLERTGIITGIKEGKSRNWYIRTGELARVKEVIAEPSRKKRNRN